MAYSLRQGAVRVIEDLKELALLTSNRDGAQRVAWTALWQTARDWYRQKAEELGAEVSMDSAGNVWTKIEGESAEAIVIGSHLDSVPNGGWLDGALGVLAGLEALRRYVTDNKKPRKTLYVVDWADEEGARYGYSCLGSSAASGSLNVAELVGRVDLHGIAFEEAATEFQVIPERMLQAHQEFLTRNITGYLELHIEQGPVLEKEHKDVACVFGAAGVERHYIDFVGQAAHAGSFPVAMRQDAFLAAAEAALEFRKLALKYKAVCTVGQVQVQPDVVTIVPGKCTISLDMRTIDMADLQKMYEEAQAVTEKIASANDVSVGWRKIYSVAPQLFNEQLIQLCEKAVEKETGEPTKMYSGPLHDAVEMAKLVPTVMMFTMSEGGLSHTKEEHTPEPKLQIGIRAFLRLVHEVMEG
ncbi:hydantoinase/carbamoylase family amidase [Metasolibacillus sp.]|uniref:hydantoinase/carbamoylase family amidase n=1 Tax=Metasolibacillus sp. TaxID=2703680 RepID=UPI0025D1C2CE|nr:hydantoinase/carbamoylase family amidase [Metasolibacillus sp.]MCT6925569.1 hydantoinase/carbamoylase family amidase [Metasolibacillus sp.]MCT6941821.1 hydantoinase/carbamoylase family amidase [Metasolibacillus sp.]